MLNTIEVKVNCVDMPVSIVELHNDLSIFLVSKYNTPKGIVHIEKHPTVGFTANVYNYLTLPQPLMSSGYGNCITAALAQTSGIDGVRLFDSNSTDARTEEMAEKMRDIHAGHPQFEILRKKARKLGAKFVLFDKEKNTYQQCFYEPGFARLEALGYDILKVF